MKINIASANFLGNCWGMQINQCRIEKEIEQITVGNTCLVFGIAVTRWNTSVFEVETWGKATSSFDETVDKVAKIIQADNARSAQWNRLAPQRKGAFSTAV